MPAHRRFGADGAGEEYGGNEQARWVEVVLSIVVWSALASGRYLEQSSLQNRERTSIQRNPVESFQIFSARAFHKQVTRWSPITTSRRKQCDL
jgi:hypothetical protein